VAPSPLPASGRRKADGTPLIDVVPVELTGDGVLDTIGDFVVASRNAIEAGFDGVELHGANDYLLHQFLSPRSNQRTDQWGGTVNNRIRLVLDLVEAVAREIGPHRVGLRISPGATANGMVEDSYADTYLTLAWELPSSDLAYLHVAESPGDRELTSRLRKVWDGPVILNPATPQRWTGSQDLHLIEDGTADLLSFGVLFISNPDLPARLVAGGPFTDPDPTTFLSGGERGYADYPCWTIEHRACLGTPLRRCAVPGRELARHALVSPA
jgi:N-ethylmaleimide reductase